MKTLALLLALVMAASAGKPVKPKPSPSQELNIYVVKRCFFDRNNGVLALDCENMNGEHISVATTLENLTSLVKRLNEQSTISNTGN